MPLRLHPVTIGFVILLCGALAFVNLNAWIYGSHHWTETIAYVWAWRSASFWYGDGTTKGRIAWIRAGYNDNTDILSTVPDCDKCETARWSAYRLFRESF